MDAGIPPAARAFHARPFYSILQPFPAVCFTLTLLTDIAYWQTSNLMWQNFSSWLLLAGLIFGALAVLICIVDLLLGRVRISGADGVLQAVGSALVLVLALLNSLVHAGDGWTAVVPNGLILSVATVALLVFLAWLDRARYERIATGDHL